jgi:UDP-3-O-[3-hydroxymyristoyl] glucosamine N-acyltransferase
MEATLEELAKLVGGRVAGDPAVRVRGVNGIAEAGPGELTFLANPRYAPLLASTKASAAVVAEGVPCPVPSIVVRNPDLAFARAAERLAGAPWRPPAGVHPGAVVARDASIGRDVSIGAACVVEPGASIGDRTVLYPQVYVGPGARIGPDSLLWPQVVVRERCELGARVVVHSGTVVGSDGFGYATDGGVHHKIPQLGTVVVGDDVEIGANVAVDRARFGATVIGRGTKIDNLVQIAHNVRIGEACLIVAQVGISGSTTLGNQVILGGQAGIAGHLEIGDRSIVTAQAGLGKDLPPGSVVSGEHAQDAKKHMRKLAALSKLPDALVELRELRKEVEALRKKLGP